MSKEIVIFEDTSQKATLSVKEAKRGYYMIERKMVSVPGDDLQLHEAIELHKDDLKELAKWIVENID